ncbi:MAG: helix-turn-helix domain containing protein [Candidatus Aminicenantes bacterium]|nr:helix-turn-helix domain containing protein [Candidatus Aminicenantes bacterium]
MGVKERREREEQTRLDVILGAAEKVFSEQGYYHTRMDDIAEAAELAKGTLYYYFKSKDEIFFHILEREIGRIIAEIKRRLPEQATLLQAVEAELNIFLEYCDRNRGFLKIFLPCSSRFIEFEDKDIARRAARSFQAHGEFIRKTFQAKIAREHLNLSIDQLIHFQKTFQIGIGHRIMEGRTDEARDAVKFYLNIMKRITKEKS